MSDRTKCVTHQRGIGIIAAVLVLAFVGIATLLLLNIVLDLSTNTRNVDQKNELHNAAEAGVDSGINTLDESLAATSCSSGTLAHVPYNYTCGIINNFAGATPEPATDPISGDAISIPPSMALVWGEGTISGNPRVAWAEEIVKAAVGLTLPAGALDAAGNGTFSGQVNINADNPPADNNAAAIANGNFTESGTVVVQGPMDSHGTNTHAGTLTDTATNTGEPLYSFPTTAQLNAYASAAQTTAQSGTTMTPASFLSTCANATACSGNIYVSGSITQSGTTSLTINGTGTVYINGNITYAGTLNVLNKNGATIVINGNVTGAGSFGYSVTPGITNAGLVVLGTGGLTVAGTGQYVATIYAPNSSITLSGASGVTGAVAAGNGDASGQTGVCNYSNGCGNITNAGTFVINYVAGLTIPPPGSSYVTAVMYAER
jgi:fibronectin-binding autotransporter adhesin